MIAVDIALPATGFAWVVGRSYNARQEASGSHMDSDGVQGKNWFQASQPSIVFYDHADNAKDMVVGLAESPTAMASRRRLDSGKPLSRVLIGPGIQGAGPPIP